MSSRGESGASTNEIIFHVTMVIVIAATAVAAVSVALLSDVKLLAGALALASLLIAGAFHAIRRDREAQLLEMWGEPDK